VGVLVCVCVCVWVCVWVCVCVCVDKYKCWTMHSLIPMGSY
jgi:hypothetical protein